MTPFAKSDWLPSQANLLQKRRRWSHIRFTVPYLRAYIRPSGADNVRLMTKIPIVKGTLRLFLVKAFAEQINAGSGAAAISCQLAAVSRRHDQCGNARLMHWSINVRKRKYYRDPKLILWEH